METLRFSPNKIQHLSVAELYKLSEMRFEKFKDIMTPDFDKTKTISEFIEAFNAMLIASDIEMLIDLEDQSSDKTISHIHELALIKKEFTYSH
jgi:hypothetical protein